MGVDLLRGRPGSINGGPNQQGCKKSESNHPILHTATPQ
jgi:hypothetical protein